MEIAQLVTGVVAGLSLGSIGVALTRLPRTGIRVPLYALVLAGLLWMVGDVIASTAQDPISKVVGITILYTGSISMPALWWAIVLRWSDDVGSGLSLRSPAWRFVPFGWAALMWLVMLSNPWHGAFLTPVIGGRNLYEPFWYAMVLPNYGLVLAALIVESVVAIRVPRRSVRRQALHLIAASGITLAGKLLYVAHIGTINSTIAVLSISGALLVVGMAREGLFGVLPAAWPAIVDHHPDGLVVVGPDGHVCYVNARAEKLLAPLAVRIDDALLRTLQHSSLKPEGASPDQVLDDSAWWSALTSGEGVLLRQRGEVPHWLHLCASHFDRIGSNEGGYYVRISDVTASKQAERHARQTRRLESVAAVARTVSREFQNTLSVVEGNALLLMEDFEHDDASARKLARVLEASRRAADLAHQLQLYAGSVDALRRPLDLADVIAEIGGLVEAELPTGTSIVLPPRDQPLPIDADPVQIRHALYNLLTNASEAMSGRIGRIIVTSGLRHLDPARTEDLVCGADRPPDDFAFVSIRDEGGGMDPETVERAFEPYFSTRSKDRGNGLSTVLGIARAHEALISLSNAEGRGCTLVLYFPLTPA